LDRLPKKLDPRVDNKTDSLDHTPRRKRIYSLANPERETVLIDPRTITDESPTKAIRIFGSKPRYKTRRLKDNNMTLSPAKRRTVNNQGNERQRLVTNIEITQENRQNTYLAIYADYPITETTIIKATKINKDISKTKADVLAIANAIDEEGDTIIITDLKTAAVNMCKNLQTWEDIGFYNRSDKDAWEQLAYKLRQHPGKISIRTIDHEEKDDMKDIKSKAKNIEHIRYREEQIPKTFRLEGAKINKLTQKIAYSLLLETKKKTPGTHTTRRNIEKSKGAHQRLTGQSPTELEIWTSMSNDVIPIKVKDFIWKLMHNRHKVGPWFLNIPNWEDKATCECGDIEDMKHILLDCDLNKVNTYWNMAEQIWRRTTNGKEWIKPDIDLIKSLGAIRLSNRNKRLPRYENEKYIEIVAETIWIIWKLRNERIFNNKRITTEKAEKSWKKIMIMKLKIEWRGIRKIKDRRRKQKKTNNFIDKWGINGNLITVNKDGNDIVIDLVETTQNNI
jgi:hypothetical protein